MWFDHLKGVQLTDETAKDIAKWTEGTVVQVQQNGIMVSMVSIYTPRGDVLIHPGDWVAVDEDNRFRILRLDTFDLKRHLSESQRTNVFQVKNPRKAKVG